MKCIILVSLSLLVLTGCVQARQAKANKQMNDVGGKSENSVEIANKPAAVYEVNERDVPCNTTGPHCLSSCAGVADGFYQYCANCSAFAQCNNGVLTVYTCPEGLQWDHNLGYCIQPPTSTCWECYRGLECGTLLHHLVEHPILPDPWNVMCYITTNDTELIDTPCYNLLQEVLDYGDAAKILAAGGNFGCWRDTEGTAGNYEQACRNTYQHNLVLSGCVSCNIMAVCLRYPV